MKFTREQNKRAKLAKKLVEARRLRDYFLSIFAKTRWTYYAKEVQELELRLGI